MIGDEALYSLFTHMSLEDKVKFSKLSRRNYEVYNEFLTSEGLDENIANVIVKLANTKQELTTTLPIDMYDALYIAQYILNEMMTKKMAYIYVILQGNYPSIDFIIDIVNKIAIDKNYIFNEIDSNKYNYHFTLNSLHYGKSATLRTINQCIIVDNHDSFTKSMLSFDCFTSVKIKNIINKKADEFIYDEIDFNINICSQYSGRNGTFCLTLVSSNSLEDYKEQINQNFYRQDIMVEWID